MRSNPYNIKDGQQLKQHTCYTKSSYKNCDSCNNFVDKTTYIEYNATGRKYKIRRDTWCKSKNAIYAAYCIKCMNYKSHVRTVTQFIENCNDNWFNNLRLTIFDCLNNVEDLTDDDTDHPLPKKEKF